ncbi:hypothetical protein IW152_003198 [Coemansia sp. BCRC 34962]|nr:hypothetical protein IW152_003198 [Coemansia sp. BCRC 34962]
MARHLSVSICLPDVYSGEALMALSQEPFKGCSLPLVRTLEVRFSFYKDREAVPRDAGVNVGAFVRRIQQLFPKPTLIKLVGGQHPWERVGATASFFDSLVAQLIQGINRVELSSNTSGYCYFPQVDTICGLTHFGCNFEFNREQFMRLMRLNAPTLLSLSITTRSGNDLSGIIQGIDGGFIEYPRLHSLKLMISGAAPEQCRFHGAVPFPSLRRLMCGIDYPFGDDLALFRGNVATLELLQLPLTRELAAALLHRNVFTPTSHPKLRYVMLRPIQGMIPVNHADNPEIVQLMLDFAPNAAVRKITNWHFKKLVPPVLSLFDKHTCLQVLALPDLRLSIWDAMTLVRSLPQLSDFYAKAPRLGPLPAGVSRRKLAVHACSNYSSAGSRFRFWHAGDDDADYLNGAAKPFLLLALAFSSFERVVIPAYRHDMFMTSVEKAMDVTEFKPNVLSLRRLLRSRRGL